MYVFLQYLVEYSFLNSFFYYFQVDVFDPIALYTNVQKLFNDVERLDGESTHEKGGLRVLDTYVDFEKVS